MVTQNKISNNFNDQFLSITKPNKKMDENNIIDTANEFQDVQQWQNYEKKVLDMEKTTKKTTNYTQQSKKDYKKDDIKNGVLTQKNQKNLSNMVINNKYSLENAEKDPLALLNRVDAIILQKDEKIRQIKAQLVSKQTEDELKECTFHPKINRCSSTIPQKRTILDLFKWEEDKKKRMLEQEITGELENQKSKKIKQDKFNSVKHSPNSKVEDRLIKYEKRKQEKMEEIRTQQIQSSKSLSTFRVISSDQFLCPEDPKVNKIDHLKRNKSRGISPISSQRVSNTKNDHAQAELLQKKNQEKLKSNNQNTIQNQMNSANKRFKQRQDRSNCGQMILEVDQLLKNLGGVKHNNVIVNKALENNNSTFRKTSPVPNPGSSSGHLYYKNIGLKQKKDNFCVIESNLADIINRQKSKTSKENRAKSQKLKTQKKQSWSSKQQAIDNKDINKGHDNRDQDKKRIHQGTSDTKLFQSKSAKNLVSSTEGKSSIAKIRCMVNNKADAYDLEDIVFKNSRKNKQEIIAENSNFDKDKDSGATIKKGDANDNNDDNFIEENELFVSKSDLFSKKKPIFEKKYFKEKDDKKNTNNQIEVCDQLKNEDSYMENLIYDTHNELAIKKIGREKVKNQVLKEKFLAKKDENPMKIPDNFDMESHFQSISIIPNLSLQIEEVDQSLRLVKETIENLTTKNSKNHNQRTKNQKNKNALSKYEELLRNNSIQKLSENFRNQVKKDRFIDNQENQDHYVKEISKKKVEEKLLSHAKNTKKQPKFSPISPQFILVEKIGSNKQSKLMTMSDSSNSEDNLIPTVNDAKINEHTKNKVNNQKTKILETSYKKKGQEEINWNDEYGDEYDYKLKHNEGDEIVGLTTAVNYTKIMGTCNSEMKDIVTNRNHDNTYQLTGGAVTPCKITVKQNLEKQKEQSIQRENTDDSFESVDIQKQKSSNNNFEDLQDFSTWDVKVKNNQSRVLSSEITSMIENQPIELDLNDKQNVIQDDKNTCLKQIDKLAQVDNNKEEEQNDTSSNDPQYYSVLSNSSFGVARNTNKPPRDSVEIVNNEVSDTLKNSAENHEKNNTFTPNIAHNTMKIVQISSASSISSSHSQNYIKNDEKIAPEKLFKNSQISLSSSESSDIEIENYLPKRKKQNQNKNDTFQSPFFQVKTKENLIKQKFQKSSAKKTPSAFSNSSKKFKEDSFSLIPVSEQIKNKKCIKNRELNDQKTQISEISPLTTIDNK